MVIKDIITLDGTAISSNISIRNLEIIFDLYMSLNCHIKQISRIAFIHVYDIADAERCICSFEAGFLESPSLESNKSFMTLQLAQNVAARVLTRTAFERANI